MSTDQPQNPETAYPDRLDPAGAARLRLALEARGDQLFTLLQDPDPELTRTLLKNPNLGEQHLSALLQRRDLPEQIVRTIHRKAAGSRRLKIALAAHPGTPAPVLTELLPQLFLFELVAVTQLPGVPADQKVAVERAIVKRLPETELGHKITLARSCTPAVLEALIKEGEPRLVDAVLANPKLKESGLLAFLRSPTATAETISAVGRHQRWGRRASVRLAMLRNRRTPMIWFTLLLSGLPERELKALLGWQGLSAGQLSEVRQELEKRRGI